MFNYLCHTVYKWVTNDQRFCYVFFAAMICPMIKHFYHDRIGHFQDASIHHPQFNEYKNDVIKMSWPSNSPDTTSNEGLDHITSNLTFLLAEPTPACAQACCDIVLLYNLCNVFFA